MSYSIIQKSQLEGAERIDADYYQSEYLDAQKRLKLLHSTTLDQLTNKIDVGFVSSMTSHFQETGIPLLRTQNVKEFLVNTDDNMIFIDEEFHKKLKKSQIKPGQVLLARSGSIGEACFVPQDFPIANSADIISIETKENLLPEFLTAFINSKYGKFQIDRAASGGLQGHMNLFSLEKLLIPIFSLDSQRRIKQLVDEIFKYDIESKNYYREAEELLLRELGLKDYKANEDLWSVVNFSDIKKAERIDADYFQPKYEQIITKIKSKNSRTLGDLIALQKGFEPGSEAYQEEGKLFIRVSSLSQFGIEDKDQKYLKNDLYNKLKKNYEPKLGEILLTKDATPGIAYAIKESIEGIISGGILILKLKEDIEPEYLTLCINSIIGKMQVEQDSGGSIISHWKPEQVKSLLIPILPKETQKQIADLVKKSHEARKKSKELLEEAKRKVEEMIDSANSLQVEKGNTS